MSTSPELICFHNDNLVTAITFYRKGVALVATSFYYYCEKEYCKNANAITLEEQAMGDSNNKLSEEQGYSLSDDRPGTGPVIRIILALLLMIASGIIIPKVFLGFIIWRDFVSGAIVFLLLCIFAGGASMLINAIKDIKDKRDDK